MLEEEDELLNTIELAEMKMLAHWERDKVLSVDERGGLLMWAYLMWECIMPYGLVL